MKDKIKKLIQKNNVTRRVKDSIVYNDGFSYDKKHYVKNHRGNRQTKAQLCYDIMLLSHALEKGMSFDKLRPFGKEKITEIICSIGKLEKLGDFENESAFIITINTLRKYAKIYAENGWKDEPEYFCVKKLIDKYVDIEEIKVGVETLSKDKIFENNVDYAKFISGRHSIRKFAEKRLSDGDIKKAIEIARLTPSACNRQMIKVYYAKSNQTDEFVKSTIRGNLSGFDVGSANSIVVTFDASAFGSANERTAGYFNAGLFSMNLVNAMHSLGIGSCFCEFAQPVKKEIALKKALDIPESERIAVVIMAGYYLDENKVYLSPRIKVDEIYRER